jgi:hypothetical protein
MDTTLFPKLDAAAKTLQEIAVSLAGSRQRLILFKFRAICLVHDPGFSAIRKGQITFPPCWLSLPPKALEAG